MRIFDLLNQDAFDRAQEERVNDPEAWLLGTKLMKALLSEGDSDDNDANRVA